MKQHIGIRILSWIFRRVNQRIQWHQLWWPIGILNLLSFRNVLRSNNLFDMEAKTNAEMPPIPERWKTARSDDGSYNDLAKPSMGMAGSRFGRNCDHDHSIPGDSKLLMHPNPREISQRLLARDTFKPVPFLNMHAASWIQFQVHGWMNHERKYDEWIEIPLGDDDDWHENPMRLRQLAEDELVAGVPTYRNTESHWWDGSQIYGSTIEIQDKLRTFEGGKIKIDDNGLLPADPDPKFGDPEGKNGGIDMTGFSDNYWLGLCMLHTCLLYTSDAADE